MAEATFTTAPSAQAHPATLPLLLTVMVASGCAALGYQIVWTQQAALWLGHEAAAALAVICAFFGGLALGSWCLGAAISRSTRPARWYAGCEGVIALWGLVLAAALQPASQVLNTLLGTTPSAAWQALVTFGGSCFLLLPATMAMGATLPAMERLLAQQRSSAAAPIALLYAGNTLGGVLGVLAVAFWWLPQWGLAMAALICALLNVLCAVGVLLLPSLPPGSPTFKLVPSAARTATASTASQRPQRRRLAGLLALTGLLGIAYEVVVLRVLSQVAENTVYTLALLLAVYLAGTALGAAAWARWGPHWLAPAPAKRAGLLAALSLACVLSGAALWLAPWFKAALLLLLQAGFAAALAAEAGLAVLAFAAPTLVMGALFSHLCEEAAEVGLGFSAALAVNTAGAALAPVLFGAGLVVALGAKTAVLVVAAGYAALALWAARAASAAPSPVAADKGHKKGQPHRAPLLAAALLAALALLAPPLVRVDKPAGATLISHREGALGTVSVVQDPAGTRVLRINNRQQEGSNITAVADARQALLPLLLHPAPRSALLLGLGTGVTAQAAALDPAVKVLAVELLPEVVAASQHFDGVLGSTTRPANLQVQVADARRFVLTSGQRWDVIVSDNFHPARAGSAALYTVEHFAAVKQRLARGGTFCQWLPLHQMDLATLRSIVRSFLAVYPEGAALLATNSLQTPVLGLWAQRDAAPLQAAAVRQRLQAVHFQPPPPEFGIVDEWALLGSFIAGPQALLRFAARAPLNTDNHPVVSTLAPRATYAAEATPAQRLLAVLDALSAHTGPQDPTPTAPGTDAARLAAYQQARRHYIAAGHRVQADADPARMLAQVQAPLLAVLQTSPDFLPAYEPLLRLAIALKPSQPQAAQALLQELVRRVPAQPGAQEALLARAPDRAPASPH